MRGNPSEKFKGKRIAVLGFGMEGKSALEFVLNYEPAFVTVFDEKERSHFDDKEIREFEAKGIEFCLEPFLDFSGYNLIIRSPGISLHVPALEKALREGIEVSSATKIFFDYCEGLVVGITGTKGKGTTAALLFEIFRADGKEAFLGGNIGVPLLSFLPRLTPESVSICELSSFQLIDLEKSPQIAIVLMVTSEHLNYHEDEDEYAKSKANIARFQKKEELLIVNSDYPRSREIAALSTAKKLSVSRRGEVGDGTYVLGQEIIFAEKGERKDSFPVPEVALPGAHNLENVCAAITAAKALSLGHESILRALRSFRGLPHRLEFVREARGVKYYNDSISTTPESAIAAAKAFPEPKILILGGSSKSADFSELASAIASDASVKTVIGIGAEWPRIKSALLQEGAKQEILEGFTSMQEAVSAAASAALPGIIVILSPACASFGMFKNYKDRGEQFKKAVGIL